MSQLPASASYTGVKPYRPAGAGRTIMVDAQQKQILDGFRRISEEASSQGFHAKAITNAIEGLRGCASPVNSFMKNGNPSRRCIVYSDFEIEYEIGSYYGGPQTDITIVDIRFTKQKSLKKSRPALWEINRVTDRQRSSWKPNSNPSSILTRTKKCSGTKTDAIKVGINGFCDNLLHAARMLPSHITQGDDASLDQYQLFYVPQDGSNVKAGWRFLRDIGRTSSDDLLASRILANHMAEAHRQGLYIEWTSHRGGSKVLTKAMKLLAQSKVDLQGTQKVFLSDHTSSHFEADRARRSIGMNTNAPKWHNSNSGIAQLVGGQAFGASSLACSLNELIYHTKREELGGKLVKMGVGAYGAHEGLNQVAKLVSEHGLSPQLAKALLGIVSAAAANSVLSSFPSLNEKYSGSKFQALENLGNKVSGRTTPQNQ
ncbi:hypothetical protein [Microbulbifer sp.]|uniref:hypothetical protein n=1 Tax=Microbulbifer sp. TaxID=1908541 RepID=UPI0025865F8E|nr:hypothetical protein [Microbulbifer sp.]